MLNEKIKVGSITYSTNYKCVFLKNRKERDDDPMVKKRWILKVLYRPVSKFHIIRDNIIKLIMTVMVSKE